MVDLANGSPVKRQAGATDLVVSACAPLTEIFNLERSVTKSPFEGGFRGMLFQYQPDIPGKWQTLPMRHGPELPAGRDCP